jgi:hypothetical protein
MPEAQVIFPDEQVHKLILENPPERLERYLTNKFGLKPPYSHTELIDRLKELAQEDPARFDRLTDDIYKFYEERYVSQGDEGGKVEYDDYKARIQTVTSSGDSEPEALPEGDTPSNKDEPEGYLSGTDMEQEIKMYQLAIAGLAILLLISIAR